MSRTGAPLPALDRESNEFDIFSVAKPRTSDPEIPDLSEMFRPDVFYPPAVKNYFWAAPRIFDRPRFPTDSPQNQPQKWNECDILPQLLRL